MEEARRSEQERRYLQLVHARSKDNVLNGKSWQLSGRYLGKNCEQGKRQERVS